LHIIFALALYMVAITSIVTLPASQTPKELSGIGRIIDEVGKQGTLNDSSKGATLYKVPCPRTQQTNLPVYLYTIPFYAERQVGKL